jgi:hypothetical protein
MLAILDVFRPALTAPSFANMLVIFSGWVMTSGRHAVTEALVVTDVAARRHHETFHRFFSRGTWSPDEMGRLLFMRILAHCAGLHVSIDDTLAHKKGPHVFGIGCHIDAVRSSKGHKVFAFGHVWVVLAVMVPVPFSKRRWALPVLFRLYRNKKECKKAKAMHRKKTELAKEMLGVLLAWLPPDRKVELSADSAYCNATVLADMRANLTVFGSMRPDAVLTAAPKLRRGAKPRPGRPAKRGRRLQGLKQLACNKKVPWRTCHAVLYGVRTKVSYKTIDCQWYTVCGIRLLRVVIVRCVKGKLPFRVIFTTDPSLSPVQIIEGYNHRWNIEVCFRELKQDMGFADSSARKAEAVERTAPFVALAYSALVIWFLENGHTSAVLPFRPWYTHKKGFSFLDVLRAAQATMRKVDILSPERVLPDLMENPAKTESPQAPSRRAA